MQSGHVFLYRNIPITSTSLPPKIAANLKAKHGGIVYINKLQNANRKIISEYLLPRSSSSHYRNCHLALPQSYQTYFTTRPSYIQSYGHGFGKPNTIEAHIHVATSHGFMYAQYFLGYILSRLPLKHRFLN